MYGLALADRLVLDVALLSDGVPKPSLLLIEAIIFCAKSITGTRLGSYLSFVEIASH